MAWIKMRCELGSDPAVLDLMAALGLDEFAVVGRLHKVWSWADGASRDGHVRSVTPQSLTAHIDRIVTLAGFAAALVGVGWLLVKADRITFPNFERHMSKSAKERGLAAERQARKRRDDASRNKRDTSVTREEKSREEKRSTPSLRSGVGARGSRLPDDSELTPEWRKIAREESVPDAEVDAVFREFHGYWTALPGPKACKLDWSKTWRNQCIKLAPKFRPRATPPDRPDWKNSRAPEHARQNIPDAKPPDPEFARRMQEQLEAKWREQRAKQGAA
jgi:hypothetical protein